MPFVAASEDCVTDVIRDARLLDIPKLSNLAHPLNLLGGDEESVVAVLTAP